MTTAVNETVNETVSESVTSLSEGQIFDGRWLLQKRLHEFPSGQLAPLNDEWSKGKFLGRGSFGEAWEAIPRGEVSIGSRTLTGVSVVLKIFYRKIGGQIRYITQDMLSGDRDAEREIQSVKSECVVVQEIIRVARIRRDVGRDRFVDCYGVVEGTSGRDPMYVVLGRGGDSITGWIKAHVGHPDHHTARKIMGNLLQAVRSMSTMKLTHHDLKPDNAVFDGETARFIDFGAVMTVVEGEEHQSATATPCYGPPEYLGLGTDQMAYSLPVHSYDVYSLGMVYIELLCPKMSMTNGFNMIVKYAQAKRKRKIRSQFRAELSDYGCSVGDEDLEIVEAMTSFSPFRRPSPDQILEWAPFATIAGEIGEGGRGPAGNFSEADLAGIKESVAFNKKVGGGAGGGRVDMRNAKQKLDDGYWAPGYSCKRRIYVKQMTNTKNSRQNCGMVCGQYFEDNYAVLKEKFENGEDEMTCCMLIYNDPNPGDRMCGVGFGGAQVTFSKDQASGLYANQHPLRMFKSR